MSIAAKLNLKIDVGSEWLRSFVWKDPDGVRINLAGWAARMQIKDRYNGNVLIDLTTENGYLRLEQDTIDGDIAGVIVITIPAVLTEDIDATVQKKGVYDLEMVDSVSEPHRILQGIVTFRPQVTQ